MNRHSFTLVELMITAAVLVVALLGVLAVFNACFTLSETARNLTIATNGAQSKMEEMCGYNFDAMAGDYSPGGSIGNTFIVDPGNWLVTGDQRAVVYILDPATGAILNTGPGVNPGLDLYQITISVSWRQRGGRIVGEDLDLDGTIDTGEDINGDNRLNSPAQLTTLISNWP